MIDPIPTINVARIRQIALIAGVPTLLAKHLTRGKHQCVVYAISAPRRIYIGSTTDLRKRLGHHQTSNPDELRLIGLAEGDRAWEHDVQGELHRLRIRSPRGDWFEDSWCCREILLDLGVCWQLDAGSVRRHDDVLEERDKHHDCSPKSGCKICAADGGRYR